MILAIDFDGTIVSQDRDYDDLKTPLQFMPGALDALRAMKKAGHILIVNSARSRLSLREDWRLNPLWIGGHVPFSEERWVKSLPINQARYQQMLDFVTEHLNGIVDCVDDGRQGKIHADLFIDDRNLAYEGLAGSWDEIVAILAEDGDEQPQTH